MSNVKVVCSVHMYFPKMLMIALHAKFSLYTIYRLDCICLMPYRIFTEYVFQFVFHHHCIRAYSIQMICAVCCMLLCIFIFSIFHSYIYIYISHLLAIRVQCMRTLYMCAIHSICFLLASCFKL